MKRPDLQKEPAPSVFGLSSADKLTALPEEAGHPRANNRQSLAQYQQETVRQIQPMDTKRTPTGTHPGQVKATKNDAVEIPLGPSELEGDPNSSEVKRDTIRGCDSADSCQALGYPPAANDHATSDARDGTEQVANGTKLKVSFHMVIHLAKGEVAIRVARLDTGATVDVISIDVVNSLGLVKEPYRGPPLKPLGTTYCHPQGQVKFDWHVATYHKTYTSTFAILDEKYSTEFDILLGEKTMGVVGFYKRDDTVFFIKSDEDEMPLSLGVDDAKHILPSLEVDKQISG